MEAVPPDWLKVGVELLVDRLVALNKPFALMPYPGRSHSISEGANTTRHLYTLLKAVDKPFARPLLHTIPGAGYRLAADDAR